MSTLAYIRRNIKYARPKLWRAGVRAVCERLFRTGEFTVEDELPSCSLKPFAKLDKVIELFKPASVLDLGCGTGQSVAYLRQRGVDAVGIEGSRLAIERSPVANFICRADLRKPIRLNRVFDVTWSFEVAEHIRPNYVETLVDNFVRHSTIVVISAAHPGQGGIRHFNEQPQTYWIEKFASRGYQLHPEWTRMMQSIQEEWSENVMVYVGQRAGTCKT